MSSISDGVSGGIFTHAKDHASGAKRHTVATTGPIVAKFDNIAGICGEVETTMFVTSSEWAMLAREVSILTKQVNPENFRRLKLRNLTVVKADSDDQAAVNRANILEAQKCDFQNRRKRLITGRL